MVVVRCGFVVVVTWRVVVVTVVDGGDVVVAAVLPPVMVDGHDRRPDEDVGAEGGEEQGQARSMSRDGRLDRPPGEPARPPGSCVGLGKDGRHGDAGFSQGDGDPGAKSAAHLELLAGEGPRDNPDVQLVDGDRLHPHHRRRVE